MPRPTAALKKHQTELAKMRRELDVARKKAAQWDEAVQKRELEWAKREAMAMVNHVMRLLKVNNSNAKAWLPMVAGVIADLGAVGLIVGDDMTPELVADTTRLRIARAWASAKLLKKKHKKKRKSR